VGWELGRSRAATRLRGRCRSSGRVSRAKIGINLDNSTGSINFRTFALPANGVMQICDNQCFLGQIFELGKEVIGCSEIEEVPDLVRFYLVNKSERIRIATAVYERAHSEYTEVEVFRRQLSQIGGLLWGFITKRSRR
jgi:spore maturation protein CgeB